MNWKTRSVLTAGVLLLIAAIFLWRTGLAVRSHPNALWHIVHDLCTPDERANHLPAPCTAVDLAAGYAVLRDERGATQVLVIPTARITGIEDPATRADGAPDYWQDAWLARTYVEKLAGKPIPRDDIALAVNSIPGRSQNQLHIHVDCVRPDVKAIVSVDAGAVRTAWAPFPTELHNRHYRALWIAGADLSTVNPFRLLADGDAAAAADMGNETLVAIPATSPAGAQGFVLLSDHAHPGDDGHGEALQDHDCRVLNAD